MKSLKKNELGILIALILFIQMNFLKMEAGNILMSGHFTVIELIRKTPRFMRI